MSPILEQLRDYWLAQNVEISGASEEEVTAFEREHGVSLPPLFREYAREINGMGNADCDSDLVFFWPLSRMRKLSDLNYSSGDDLEYLWTFADYRIGSHDYAIRLSPDSLAPAPVCVPWVWQMDSFEEFVRRYLEGDEELIYLVKPAST